jgi:YidC/Oxa1 family membrane protein insertase
LFSWPLLVNKIFPPKPLPPGMTNAPVTSVAGTNPPAPTTISTAAPPILEAPTTRVVVANTNEPEQLLEVTNANAHYTFSSYGGGLKLVELVKYPESVSTRRERQGRSSRVATLNTFTPAPTLAVDGPSVQGDGIYKLTPRPNGVRAEKTLTSGLTIVKDFEASTNYLVFATVRLENRSDQPLAVPAQEWFAGTATPMNVQDDGSAVGVMWYNGAGSRNVGASDFSGGFLSCVAPRAPPTEYRGSNVVWAAIHNQFFALATMPQDPAAQLIVHKIELPPPKAEEITYRTVRQPVGYEAMLVYPGTNLPPHQGLGHNIVFFAGPKEYRTLATISAALGNNIDLIMGFGGFFGFFSKALLLWMNWLHNALGISYGWTIIVITITIKIVFWPLTQASTRSAKRMQALQPQIKALQEKYKDDPVKAQRKMMEFWKEHKVNPMSGCLPTLIQMPVFIGFFYMIRSAIELRGASFLWVGDLSRPDTLFYIPGINFPFNLLPLIMGATMLWQARLTPVSPGTDPAQAKIMKYMPLMFMVFLYNFSAGLTLYWTVQNLLSIVQTKLTRTRPEAAGSPGPQKAPVLTSPQKKRK